ncbi:DUF6653 family protein [Natrinema marinum]|uniref:DUF6653 family protein n=1 Tax=Natrinema marinum TaxID=2961598 RepID=UPI0020C85A4E|nr:DUF6653 family protein [Natrinema marinum]
MSTKRASPLADLREIFWRRHSNPKSGWSRTLLLPAILTGIYHRNWRLVIGAVVFAVLNPLLFAPPENDDAWMTRVVLTEQWWTDEMNRGVLSASYPNVLNLLNVPLSAYALVAAYRRQPYRAIVAGVLSMGLKFLFVGALVRRYDAR